MAHLLNPNRKSFKYGIRSSGQQQCNTDASWRDRPERQERLMFNSDLHASAEDIEKFRRTMGRA